MEQRWVGPGVPLKREDLLPLCYSPLGLLEKEPLVMVLLVPERGQELVQERPEALM